MVGCTQVLTRYSLVAVCKPLPPKQRSVQAGKQASMHALTGCAFGAKQVHRAGSKGHQLELITAVANPC